MSALPSPSRAGRVSAFIRQLGPAGPMAILATGLPILGAIVLAALEPHFAPWMRAHREQALALFVIAFAVLGGFALVPTYANSILGGWVFGFGIGFPAVLTGLLGAAAITFAMARRLSGHRVENVIKAHPKWEIVRKSLIGRGRMQTTWIVILLRLSPLLPFETTSVLLAVTGVQPAPFLAGTVIGVAPRALAIVLAAASAEKLDLASRGSWWLIGAGAIATVIGAAVIAVIAKHALQRATRHAVT